MKDDNVIDITEYCKNENYNRGYVADVNIGFITGIISAAIVVDKTEAVNRRTLNDELYRRGWVYLKNTENITASEVDFLGDMLDECLPRSYMTSKCEDT